MGYDLHITRADCWLDSKQNPIIFEEWEWLVNHDIELTFKEKAETNLPDGQISQIESDGITLWEKRGFLKCTKAWFRYRNGQIQVTGPDETVIRKMKSIAEKLNARVVGDDDENY